MSAAPLPVRGNEGQSDHSRARPALYDAQVRHVRRQTMNRSFSHGIYLWLVDLDALPRLPRWLAPFARFEARDHLGDPTRTIRENLDAWLALQGVDLRGGQVLMLANARLLGYVFNPISVYWCHTPEGTLECVVTEVHNTYGERHCYLLYPDDAGRAEVDKAFYVSPFLTVDGRYRMSLPLPAERLALAVTLRQSVGGQSVGGQSVGGQSVGGRSVGGQDERTALSATVVGERRPATPAALVRMLVRRPLTTYRTSALIRRHGITLWLRRLPVIRRPRHVPQEGVQ